MHENSSGVNPGHAVDQIAHSILFLLHGHQYFRIRRFHTKEDSDEVDLTHQCEKRGIIGKIDGGLCPELKWIAVPLLPIFELRKELADLLLIADKIIINEEYIAAMSGLIERIEFRQHLCGRLGPRDATV